MLLRIKKALFKWNYIPKNQIIYSVNIGRKEIIIFLGIAGFSLEWQYLKGVKDQILGHLLGRNISEISKEMQSIYPEESNMIVQKNGFPDMGCNKYSLLLSEEEWEVAAYSKYIFTRFPQDMAIVLPPLALISFLQPLLGGGILGTFLSLKYIQIKHLSLHVHGGIIFPYLSNIDAMLYMIMLSTIAFSFAIGTYAIFGPRLFNTWKLFKSTKLFKRKLI